MEDGAMPVAEVGFGQVALSNGLAADKDVAHGAMMALATDTWLEVDVRAEVRPRFDAGVDLAAEYTPDRAG
jgi:hypothetical protein